jgi:predicted phosphodiesterase
MERIVVIADTHMPRSNRALVRALLDAVKSADAIFHLGDSPPVLTVHDHMSKWLLDGMRPNALTSATYGSLQ